MQFKLIISLIWISCLGFSSAQTSFNRASFYNVLTGDNLLEIDSEITLLSKTSGKEAFKGALLMKKSGLMAQTKDKLAFFKEGRNLLELAITKDSTNTEYHFLRLLIQENAPKIVHYNSEIKKDASYLRANYKNLSPVLQNTVLNYSKNSKVLNPQDFKNSTHD